MNQEILGSFTGCLLLHFRERLQTAPHLLTLWLPLIETGTGRETIGDNCLVIFNAIKPATIREAIIR